MISVKNLSKGYLGKDGVRNISFDIATGTAMALVGPSGCGKTTTLRLIAGLEKPDSGEIFLGGNLVSSSFVMVPPYDRSVAMVFQDLALWPHMNVEAHILFALDSKKYPRTARKTKCQKILELVELDQLKRYPHELSGGEQQRLALARAIASEPEILLMDEPFSHLDAGLKDRVLKDMKELINKLQMTVVYVSHQMDEAQYMADIITTMESGHIVSSFSADTGNDSVSFTNLKN